MSFSEEWVVPNAVTTYTSGDLETWPLAFGIASTIAEDLGAIDESELD